MASPISDCGFRIADWREDHRSAAVISIKRLRMLDNVRAGACLLAAGSIPCPAAFHVRILANSATDPLAEREAYITRCRLPVWLCRQWRATIGARRGRRLCARF